MHSFFNGLAQEFSTPFHNSVLIFSVILFIILLAPLVFRKLKIPGIMVLIVSGVFIGPSGFNLIERNSAVELFSTIGLLYIMFLAGLDLNLNEFAKNKYKSLLFGFLTFSIPLCMGFPVLLFGLGYNLQASLLTASMFATHTLVAYPIVSRLGISRNEAVAITVGGTILTDTAVLILLAIISGSVGAGLGATFWLKLSVLTILFLIVVFVLVPKLAAWFFKHLEAEKNSHFIFVLSIVFFAAFLAHLAGLEPIIGAFAAGISLNRLIPHTSSLMNRLDFVGNSLFIPFFLIGVGMLVNVRIILAGPWALIIALVLTATALLGKWGAAFIASWALKYSSNQRNIIFGLSSSHAAATLAVITVGYNLQIVDENILNGTIILVLVTCLVASFITEKAARKMVIEERETQIVLNPSDSMGVLVPIANPTTIEKLLDFAFIINGPNPKAKVICLSVVNDDQQVKGKLIGAKKMLEQAHFHAAAADSKVKVLATIDQNVINGIKRVANENFLSDIVIGYSHKSTLQDILFGKMMENLVERVSQTVYVNGLCAPINLHTKINIFCAEHAEKEDGFAGWLQAIVRLGSASGLGVVFYCPSNTYGSIEKYMSESKQAMAFKHRELANWDGYEKLGNGISQEELTIFVLPRKGSLSYSPNQDIITEKAAKDFGSHSFVLIYPHG